MDQYWDEVYLFLTALTTVCMWRAETPIRTSVVLLWADWVVSNAMHHNGHYSTAENIVVDSAFLLLFYSIYVLDRAVIYIWGIGLTIGVIVWHLITSLTKIDPYTYAVGINLLFLAKLCAVWFCHFSTRGHRLRIG